MGVAAGRILAHGFGPRVVRAGRLRNPHGKPCAASARKALPRLAKQLGLALPPIQMRVPSCRQRGVQRPRPVQFAGSLRQLGEVWLERA